MAFMAIFRGLGLLFCILLEFRYIHWTSMSRNRTYMEPKKKDEEEEQGFRFRV